MDTNQLTYLSSLDYEIRHKAYQFGWYEVLSGKEGYNLTEDMARLSPEMFCQSLPEVLAVLGEDKSAIAAEVLVRLSASAFEDFITEESDNLFRLAVEIAVGSKRDETKLVWFEALKKFSSDKTLKAKVLAPLVCKEEWLVPIVDDLLFPPERFKTLALLEGFYQGDCNVNCLRLIEKLWDCIPKDRLETLLKVLQKAAVENQKYSQYLIEKLLADQSKMLCLNYFHNQLADILDDKSFNHSWRYEIILRLIQNRVVNDSQLKKLCTKLPLFMRQAAPEEQLGMWKKLEQVLKKLLKAKPGCWFDIILLTDECARALAHSNKPAFLWLEKPCPQYDVRTIAAISFEVWLIKQLKIHIPYGAHNFGSVVFKALVFLISVKAGKRIAKQREDILSCFENWEVKLEFSQLEDILTLLAKHIDGNEVSIGKLLNKAVDDDELLDGKEFGDDNVFALSAFIEEHKLEVPAFRRKYLSFIKAAEHEAKFRKEILKSLEWQ